MALVLFWYRCAIPKKYQEPDNSRLINPPQIRQLRKVIEGFLISLCSKAKQCGRSAWVRLERWRADCLTDVWAPIERLLIKEERMSHLFRILLISFAIATLAGCAPYHDAQLAENAQIERHNDVDLAPQEVGEPVAETTQWEGHFEAATLAKIQRLPTSTTPIKKAYRPHPLAWEHKSSPKRAMWSAYTAQVIGTEGANTFLPGSKDIGQFCPQYKKLNSAQKINFWAYLISAIAKFESGFKTTTRFREHGLGRDAVTGGANHSEGLLQLSYQDARYHSCAFDWSKDKHLPVTSAKKTIFDPLRNLQCGVKILAKQLKKHGRISIQRGAYWSVLRPGGRYSKVNQIKAMTRKLPFC